MPVSIWRIPKTEQVYTFKHEDTGLVQHFAVDQLNKYLRGIDMQPEPVIIHHHLLQQLINRGGWEKAHLENLPDEAMEVPCTLIAYTDGTHILADGVHRVLKRAMKGHQEFMAYHVPERIWKRFLIVDFPEWACDWDDFLTNGDRHEGLSSKAIKRKQRLKH